MLSSRPENIYIIVDISVYMLLPNPAQPQQITTAGQYKKAGIIPKRKLEEFRVSDYPAYLCLHMKHEWHGSVLTRNSCPNRTPCTGHTGCNVASGYSDKCSPLRGGTGMCVINIPLILFSCSVFDAYLLSASCA